METQPIVICIKDLIFETKVRSTAQALGLSVTSVPAASMLAAELARSPARLVIVDLNTAGPDAVDAIRQAKAASSPPRILAFVSHVNADLAAAASAAGADDVMPRSRFHAELPRLLQA
jgi:DNA-binding NarL/FixJ family response regulator